MRPSATSPTTSASRCRSRHRARPGPRPVRRVRPPRTSSDLWARRRRRPAARARRCATSAARASTATTPPATRLTRAQRAEHQRRQEFGREHPRRRAQRSGSRPSGWPGCPRTGSPRTRADEDGLVTITTDYPDVVPFATFAHDREARRELHGVPQPRLARQRRAAPGAASSCAASTRTLLGYDDWADYDAEVKMIGDGRRDPGVHRPDRRGAPRAEERDRDVVLDRLPAGRTPTPTAIDAGRLALLRRAGPPRAATTSTPRQVRTYFDFAAGAPGPPRRHRPAVRPDLRAAPRTPCVWHDDGRRVRRRPRRRRPAPRPDLPRPAPARGQVQARRAVHLVRRASPAGSCPRACWSATSRAA